MVLFKKIRLSPCYVFDIVGTALILVIFGCRTPERAGVQGAGRAPQPTEGGDEEEGAPGEWPQVHGHVLPTTHILFNLQRVHLVSDAFYHFNFSNSLVNKTVVKGKFLYCTVSGLYAG